MVNKKFLRITVVLIALFVALLGHMNAGMAASVDSNGQALSLAFTVSGDSNNVSQVKSPNDYRTLNARFLDISKVPLQLTDVSYYVVKGLVGSDGEYHYPFKVHAEVGIQVGGIDLAADPIAHTRLMAVGIPTAASSAAMDQRSSDASSRTPSMTFTANSTTSTAPLHLIWYDPINIWVAEVMTDLRWSWDGLQVSNCAWQDQWEHWYGPSGWNKYTGPFYYGPDYNFSSGRYTWCKVNTTVSFVNLAFCNPSKFTHISVYQNIAYGNRDGSRDWLGDTVAAGDCEQFLNKRHIRSTAVVSLEYLG